jgi:hypothetical protein
MKKTLLMAAAALAAGVISSQAGVYSQNVVGYVNQTLPLGFTTIANPLDAQDPAGTGVNNAITNVIPVLTGNYDGDILYFWTGSTFVSYTIDSGWPTGIGNSLDSAAVAPPVLSPGTAIYLDNTIGKTTNTFVGVVHVDGVATIGGTIGVTTNNVPLGYTFFASKLPVGGGISSVLGLPADGTLDGSVINIPNVGADGFVHGYTQYTIDSGWSTGFGNALDSAAVPEPQIPVGGGFLLQNTAAAVQWVQSY